MTKRCPLCEDAVQPIARQRTLDDGAVVYFLVCPLGCSYVFEKLTDADWDDDGDVPGHHAP